MTKCREFLNAGIQHVCLGDSRRIAHPFFGSRPLSGGFLGCKIHPVFFVGLENASHQRRTWKKWCQCMLICRGDFEDRGQALWLLETVVHQQSTTASLCKKTTTGRRILEACLHHPSDQPARCLSFGCGNAPGHLGSSEFLAFAILKPKKKSKQNHVDSK